MKTMMLGVFAACGVAANCELFAERFKAAGGKIDVRKRWGYGHHPHGFEHGDIPQIVKFFE